MNEKERVEGDRDSLLWSSEDGKSNDLSITTTADMDENYFSPPVDDESLTTEDDLEAAIDHVKILVLETEGISEERKKLVKRLIELRLKLQAVRDVQIELGGSTDDFRLVNDHQFIIQKQPLHRSIKYCDRCGGIIWTIIQSWYACKGCSYQCHTKCVSQIVRKCQFHKVSNATLYIHDICPEAGLPSQNYKCVECKSHFTMRSGWVEPRKCDYDGLYYCPICHKNMTMIIPARILRNWDFEERRVSEASRQFLMLMARRPNIHVEVINCKLFGFVKELNVVKGLRQEIILMKDYLRTCREATRQKMLRRLEERQHFVENSYMYSLQDLIDVHNGTLIKFVEKVHATFLKHIKQQCQACRGKGFICEICENIQVIFPFDSAIHQCPSCHAVFHNICFAKRESCPKCLRLSSRASSSRTRLIST